MKFEEVVKNEKLSKYDLESVISCSDEHRTKENKREDCSQQLMLKDF